MKALNLNAQKRSVIGRKVKQLRKNQLVPGNVFGKRLASIAVQVPMLTFKQVFTQAGETGLVNLSVDGDVRPVLIKDVQIHPVHQKPLHVDFYQVDLKEKVKANVPLRLIGSAPAVDQKLGILLPLIDEIEVEALPTDLPEFISVDVSGLAAVDDHVTVAQLVLPDGVVSLSEGAQEVVKVGELVTKEAEELAKAEAEAAAAAAATAAPTGEATAETAEAAPSTPTETKPEAPEAEKKS